MTRVLVTGGSGFLGRAVVAALAEHPQVDNVVSGDLRVPPAADQRPDVAYVRMDVTDTDLTPHVRGIDTVVHLASIVNPGRDTTREQEHAVDVGGSRHVLEACLATGVGRLVVSSSGAAYGYHADNPAWLTESDPLRGNDTFAYAQHKRLVEEMLATARAEHPELEQVVLRIGTILGDGVDNQITALFEKPRLLVVRGSDSPFVFIRDTDVAAIMVQAVVGHVTGIFNVAGDGAMTVHEIAAAMGKGTITVPVRVLKAALALGQRLGRTPHGPEQTDFLQHRPVLDNTRLKEEFGYTPRFTSRQAFAAWRVSRTR